MRPRATRPWPRIIALSSVLLAASCASIPKEAVTLSATVGRDIQELHRSHRATVETLYQRLRKDADKFVDEVYAPYLGRKLVQSFRADLTKSLSVAKEGGQTGDEFVENANALVSEIRQGVESLRSQLLGPLAEYEHAVLREIDRAYETAHYANSVVTGHLASVVKIQSAQDELLKKVPGLDDARIKIEEKALRLSDTIARISDSARRNKGEVEKAVETLKQALKEK